MKLEKSLFLVSVAAFLAVSAFMLPTLSNSARTFYMFELQVPDEVLAQPGEEVTVDGGILVTGMYWLHNFDLKVEGPDYEYAVTPSHFDEVRILREWNPIDGVFRVPVNFTVNIKVPSGASGSHIVAITGTEYQSFRQITNSTYFVLKVGTAAQNATQAPQLEISDILVPETIKEFEPFTLSFKIDNKAPLKTAAVVSLQMPKEWQSDAASKTFSVEAGDSTVGSFSIIPTTSAGAVSLVVEYPFKDKVINFTKVGPYLVPGEKVKPTTTTSAGQPAAGEPFGVIGGAISAFTGFISSALGGGAYDSYVTSITIGIIIVLVIVIVWLLGGIFKLVQSGDRGEPEAMKSQADVSGAGGDTGGVKTI